MKSHSLHKNVMHGFNPFKKSFKGGAVPELLRRTEGSGIANQPVGIITSPMKEVEPVARPPMEILGGSVLNELSFKPKKKKNRDNIKFLF